jgi:2,6-dioxo-6-phenylhexa-3-enoate hydrolase
MVFEDSSFVEIFVKKSSEYPYPLRAPVLKAQIEAISSFDVTDKLGEIKAKTLVMSGKDDILITLEESEVLVKNIPKCGFKLFERAAHAIHIEKQKLFTDIALGFLV